MLSNTAHQSAPLKVGVIGLGMYGGTMARRLVGAGCEVAGIDPTPTARQAAARDGVRIVDSPKSLDDCQFVVLSLPTSKEVSQVCLGEGGLASASHSNMLVIDTTSGLPVESRSIAEGLEAHGISYIDAGVSGTGGAAAVESGTLTMLVGGTSEAVEKAEPVLALLGSTTIHMGPVGAGHATKTLNNMLSSTAMLATAEAVTIGIKAGLDPDKLVAAIQASQGRNFWTEHRFPNFILRGDFTSKSGGPIGGTTQRVGQAVEMGREFGVPTPIASAAHQLMSVMSAELGYRAPTTHSVLKYWEWSHVVRDVKVDSDE